MNAMTKTPAAREPQIEFPKIGGRVVRVAIWTSTAKPGAVKKLPLLFFNGIGANIELMSPLADWMPDRDIITFDMPGIGHSPAPVVPYRPWMMARLTMRLLDHYHYDRVHVLGVSWGGGMAQQFAFQHPRRVGRLVLAATSPGMLMVPGDIQVLSKMASPQRYMDPGYLKKNFETLYGGELEGADGHASRIAAPSLRGYLYQMVAMAGWTSVPFLPFLKAETLIINGDKDKIVPSVNGRILATLIPNSRFHLVKGGGHLFLVSRAKEVIPMIDKFFGEMEDAPAPASA